LLQDVIASVAGKFLKEPMFLSYVAVASTVDALEAFYEFANRRGKIDEALFVLHDGWADLILDNQLVISGGFTTDSGEGSKGYATVINSLWDFECCSIRQVRCDETLHKRLRTASLKHKDLQTLSGPLAQTDGSWRRLLRTTRLHPWSPAHRINRFRLHPYLQRIVLGRDDLREEIFKAYRHLEQLSRERTGNPRSNLADWFKAQKGQSDDHTFSEGVLHALQAIRNKRGHDLETKEPGALELLLLDHAFKLHEKTKPGMSHKQDQQN
jgi:hypothetical protein